MPIEAPSALELALRKLDEYRFASVSDRLRELQSAEKTSSAVPEKSVVGFVNILTKANWPPPTHIGLTDTGAISASWRNDLQADRASGMAYNGTVVLVFPNEGDLYEMTAMFGNPSIETEWIQLVGNVDGKKAVGLLDQILIGFHA